MRCILEGEECDMHILLFVRGVQMSANPKNTNIVIDLTFYWKPNNREFEINIFPHEILVNRHRLSDNTSLRFVFLF